MTPQEMDSVSEDPEPTRLVELTAEIVSAFVSNNHVTPTELAALIGNVAGELGKLGGEDEPAVAPKPEPAVSVRRSVRPDHLICLVCGRKMKLLKRHLRADHDLSPSAYRERFGLKPDYPMAAPNYVQQRRQLALEIGLGQPKQPRRRPRRSPVKRAPAESSS